MVKNNTRSFVNKYFGNRLFLTVFGFIVILLLVITAWFMSPPRGEPNDFSYIGLTLEDAKEKASSEGMRIRVVAGPQKEKGIFTFERDPNRVNVLTLFNIVIKAQRG